MGKKIKILVGGSAGFLMSNFIRYIMYRSKDFDIVSVDSLDNMNYKRRLYVHKKHQFYIGDISDVKFMKKLCMFENPDIIVNGIGMSEKSFEKANLVSNTLIELELPIVTVAISEEYDNHGYYKIIRDKLNNSNNCIVSIPKCLGMREGPKSGGFAFILKQILNNEEKIYVKNGRDDWAYVEDVASLIWFVIENGVKGHIRMPSLGSASLKEIAEIAVEELRSNIEIISTESSITKYYSEAVKGWVPDSSTLESRVRKTSRWYYLNRWALCL